MNWIILYEQQVEAAMKADFTNLYQEFMYAQYHGYSGDVYDFICETRNLDLDAFMIFVVGAEPDGTWDYIVFPDSEIPLPPVEEETRWIELLADEEAEQYHDDFSDEIAWYNHARQMGWE